MIRLLQITAWFNKDENVKDISPAFSEAEDWLNYAPNCWFIISKQEKTFWYERIRRFGGDNCTFMIAEVDIVGMIGFMPISYWDWFKKNGREFNVTKD